MQKICWEESFHIKHGYDCVVTLASGTPAQRRLLQEALNRWWTPLIHFHGPPTDPAKDRDLYWRIKAKANNQLRIEFLDHYVPKILELGLTVPDLSLHYNEESGHWEYDAPDWSQLKAVVTGHGPRSAQRLNLRRLSYADTQWVRDVVLGRRQRLVA
jgi:ring-1,2-phenylacetyl-CoA epoxidase subunit PaaA